MNVLSIERRSSIYTEIGKRCNLDIVAADGQTNSASSKVELLRGNNFLIVVQQNVR